LLIDKLFVNLVNNVGAKTELTKYKLLDKQTGNFFK